MKIKTIIILLLSCFFANLSLAQTRLQVNSPDGSISVKIKTGNTQLNLATYSVMFNGVEIFKNANIGFVLKDDTNEDQWLAKPSKIITINNSWTQIYGEKQEIKDNYKAITLTFSNQKSVNEKIDIEFRVYNEGIAFRYKINNKTPLTLTKENSDFAFAKNDTAWVTKTAQGIFSKKPINEIKDASERPMTLKHSDNIYYAIGEAGLVDFARMKLINTGDLTLSSVLSSEVNQVNLKSPWRYILLGNSAGDLLEKNYLLLNLNEPNQIKNTSWIVPGKVIRENSLTTNGSYQVIDFAAEHHIKYVSFDAGWYGKEDADSSDASRVMIDPARSKGPL
ncbi:MAG: hypothetical protein EOO96_08530, partial [Pedobacter sp.]